LKTVRESLHGRVIRGGFGPYTSPDLSPSDFYLRGRIKDKVYKTNPHNLEEITKTPAMRFKKFTGVYPRE
jgi:hypothetical protein